MHRVTAGKGVSTPLPQRRARPAGVGEKSKVVVVCGCSPCTIWGRPGEGPTRPLTPKEETDRSRRGSRG